MTFSPHSDHGTGWAAERSRFDSQKS